jgi:class 3 adenylate cyclase
MMPDGQDSLEIAHVLFTDIVGYSLLPMDRQKDYLAEFQRIVHDSPRVQAAEASGELVSLPTGDGMALVFMRDPIAPVQCALEIAEGLRRHPHLKVRMGVNSGPVYRVSDFNANANVAGQGINMAQRVMDCGDAGHILLSKSSADLLLQLTQWSPRLTDLGQVEVKHGIDVLLYNVTADGLGNPAKPAKLSREAAARSKRGKLRIASAAVLLLALAALCWWAWRMRAPAEEPSIAVLPFEDLRKRTRRTSPNALPKNS